MGAQVTRPARAGTVDPRLAFLAAPWTPTGVGDAGGVQALLRAFDGHPPILDLRRDLALDDRLRAEALGYLPALAVSGDDDPFHNACDAAVAALVDALCHAGEDPDAVADALERAHGLWWTPRVIDWHMREYL